MRLSDLLKMVWKNVWRNKTRTILTTLAVAIGTGAIISMVSIGVGISDSVIEGIKKQGSLLELGLYGRKEPGQNQRQIKKEDLIEALTIPHIKAILTPKRLQAEPPDIELGKYMTRASITGVNINQYQKINPKLSSGVYFKDENGAVVSYNFTKRLYSKKDFMAAKKKQTTPTRDKAKTMDPTNKTIVLNFTKQNSEGETLTKSITVRVDGVLEKPANRWENPEPEVFLSLEKVKELNKWFSTSAQNNKELPPIGIAQDNQMPEYEEIKIHVDSPGNVEKVINDLSERGFQSFSIMQSIKEIKLGFLLLQLGLGAVGAIALVVASIGIVNTMVMSIMERTKEIGVMKVIGANFSIIRRLFLLEAGYIGLFGGIIGGLGSLLVSITINFLFRFIFAPAMEQSIGPTTLPTISVVPPWLIFFGIVFSLLVGLVAGFYPANRAVGISSLEAIRND